MASCTVRETLAQRAAQLVGLFGRQQQRGGFVHALDGDQAAQLMRQGRAGAAGPGGDLGAPALPPGRVGGQAGLRIDSGRRGGHGLAGGHHGLRGHVRHQQRRLLISTLRRSMRAAWAGMSTVETARRRSRSPLMACCRLEKRGRSARQARLGGFQRDDGVGDVAGQAQLLVGQCQQAFDIVGQQFVAGAVVEVLPGLLQRVVLALGLAHRVFQLAQATSLGLRQGQRFARVAARLRQIGGQGVDALGDFAPGAHECVRCCHSA